MKNRILTLKFTIWIFTLSIVAGFMNASTALLFVFKTSHYTGNLTQVALSLAKGDYTNVIRLLILIVSFFFGAVISGALFPIQVFKPRRRYGLLLILIGIGLLILVGLKVPDTMLLSYIAFTLGVQNGMFVFYKGIVVRTTHMSGNLTDAGLAVGRFLVGQRQELWKASFQMINMLAFIMGVFTAGWLHLNINFNVLYIASVLYFGLGTYYFFLARDLRQGIIWQSSDNKK